MLDEGQHANQVDDWLERSARETSQSPEDLLKLFEAALGALWARTKTTLGEVTVAAIAERVLYNAAEKFPPFSSLRVDPNEGIQLGELRERLDELRGNDLRDGVRFVIVEFLTVIGNLTAEILTPELHTELSRLVTPHAVHGSQEAPDNPELPPGSEGEDGRS